MAEKSVQIKESRGQATRRALISAAERLFAEKGPAHVTIREINELAGQKNESALQYHFKNLAGLVAATHRFRDEQIVAARRVCLQELMQRTQKPTLHDVAYLMVAPTFALGRLHEDFRYYIRAFSLSLASGDTPVLTTVRRGDGETDRQIAGLLRPRLAHLDADSYNRRLESAIRFVSVSMYVHSHQPDAFHGPESDRFFDELIDALVGLLSAKESSQAASRATSQKTSLSSRLSLILQNLDA